MSAMIIEMDIVVGTWIGMLTLVRLIRDSQEATCNLSWGEGGV